MKKKSKTSDLEELVHRLDNMGLRQYVELSQKPSKVIFWNFVSGVARGLGFTVGTAIVLAVLYHIVSQLISMNIPYITEMLQEFIELVKNTK